MGVVIRRRSGGDVFDFIPGRGTMNSTLIIIALTLFGEARGESFDGKYAVASVIWNRANGNPGDLEAVCLKPRQFSCWNSGLTITERLEVTRELGNLAAWNDCLRIAYAMLNGSFKPLTNATHYYAHKVCIPSWASNLVDITTIGGHTFGRVEERTT